MVSHGSRDRNDWSCFGGLFPTPTFWRESVAVPPVKSVYLIGSLKNREIPKIAKLLRSSGLDVFDDWQSPGPDADDYLRDYYRDRGLSYSEVLNSYSARHIYEFDKKHLDRCDCAILVMPAGKSGHLELGYTIGKGKPGYILMDGEPERVDIMHSFATKVFMNQEEMLEHFAKNSNIY